MTISTSFATAAAAAFLGLNAAAVQAAPTAYELDLNHTFATFEVDHFGATTNRGRFDKKSGSLVLDKAGKSGKVEITLETGSVNTGTKAFDEHLTKADFFNSAQFPTARFVADKFSFDGDKVSEVAGTLTLLGKTNPVVLKATKFNCYENPMFKREVCGGDFETTLVRSQYGMNWGLNWGVADQIKVVIQVEAVKK